MPKSPEELFAAALELTNPTERAALLDRECAGNATLRAEVESLLAAHEQASTFLNKSTVDPNVSLERPGDKIGHYKLREMVGEGGCGVVYVAEQEEPIRRRVALKVIKLGMDTKQVVARFEAERQALAMMDHPNIAKVLDAGATEAPHPLPSSDEGRGQGEGSNPLVTRHSPLATHYGRPYFVMELVRGIKITDYCDQNNLATRDRLDLFIKVCQGRSARAPKGHHSPRHQAVEYSRHAARRRA